jgi:hypothetical protein
MDRQELDARIRQRPPGAARVRRGGPRDGHDAAGYLPFEPAPEDAQALREPTEPLGRVDNTPPHFDQSPPEPQPSHVPEPPFGEPERWAATPAASAPQAWEAVEGSTGDDDDAYEPYSEPDEGYPYGPVDGSRRGGGGMLPVIGFVVLAILALGVGAALAGLLGGGGAANASPTPTASQNAAGSTEPSAGPTASEDEGSSTPEPTDGPVAFPDGAEITVQPCATKDMSFDGCAVDGATISEKTMWVWIGFKDASGSDTITLELQSDGQTIDQQVKELGSILDCPGTCSGYLIGAAYRDLDPGEYQLIVRRNDDFADSATFTVEG